MSNRLLSSDKSSKVSVLSIVLWLIWKKTSKINLKRLSWLRPIRKSLEKLKTIMKIKETWKAKIFFSTKKIKTKIKTIGSMKKPVSSNQLLRGPSKWSSVNFKTFIKRFTTSIYKTVKLLTKKYSKNQTFWKIKHGKIKCYCCLKTWNRLRKSKEFIVLLQMPFYHQVFTNCVITNQTCFTLSEINLIKLMALIVHVQFLKKEAKNLKSMIRWVLLSSVWTYTLKPTW